MPDVKPWLHLFTSTIRPLYIDDAVGVLAAAPGEHYQFRYAADLVDASLLNDWATPELVGRQVAVHFSIQHPAEFHEPMFVSLRCGEVVATQIEGSVYTVTFRLTGYLPLRRVPAEMKDVKLRAERVRQHTKTLKELLAITPDAFPKSAVAGPDPLGLETLDVALSAGAAFESLVEYLSPALYASPKIFYRVADLNDDQDPAVKGESTPRRPDPATGRRRLYAGRHHTLWIQHFQLEQPPAGTQLRIEVPVGVELVGSAVYELRSRYDVIEVSLFVPSRDSETSGMISVSIEGLVVGPTVELLVSIGPTFGDAVVVPTLGVFGAVLLVVPSLVVGDGHFLAKLLLALSGTALTSVLLAKRRKLGLPS